MRRIALALGCGLAACGVDMGWGVDQDGPGELESAREWWLAPPRAPQDHDALPGPYALGATARFTVEHPRDGRDLQPWDVELEPARIGTVFGRGDDGNRTSFDVRFDDVGTGRVVVRRPVGFVADRQRFEVAEPTDLSLGLYVASVTGLLSDPIDDGAIHLVRGAEVGMLVRYKDERGRHLLGSRLLHPQLGPQAREHLRLVRAARVDTGEGGDFVCLEGVAPTDEPVDLVLSANGRELRRVPVSVRREAEIDAISVKVTPIRDRAPDDERVAWVVADTRIAGVRALGATVTWSQDGVVVGTGAFAEVLDDLAEHEVEACVHADATPPPSGGRWWGPPEADTDGDTDAPEDTAPSSDTAEPLDTAAPAPDPVCARTTIRGRLGRLGDHGFGSFPLCGCSQGPGATPVLGLLALALLRRRRGG